MDIPTIVKSVLGAIAVEQYDLIPECLQPLPIELMTEADIQKVLSCFIQICSTHNYRRGLNLILAVFEQRRYVNTEVDVVFTVLQYDLDRITFVFSCYDRTALEWYLDLCNIKSKNVEDLSSKVLPKMVKVFKLTSHEIRLLLKSFEELDEEVYPNYVLYNHLSELFQTTPAEKPDWIKKFEHVDASDKEEFKSLLTPEEALPLLYSQMTLSDEKGKPVDLDEIREVLVFQYSLGLAEEKLQMCPVENIKVDDIDIFRRYGPVNTAYKRCEWDHSVCSKYGGCRMLLCNEYANNDDDFEIEDHVSDWWTGRCDYCGCVIQKKQYALRMPVLEGGWQGCYCSLSCITEIVPNKAVAFGIAMIKVQLDEIGIADCADCADCVH